MTYKIASIGQFARWTKRVVADPKSARGVEKRWFDTEATAEKATRREASSPESLVRLLSEDNLALLQVIGREKPVSMQVLADLVGRKQSNLSRTLKKLAAAGIVRLDPGPRRTIAPVLLARHVTLDLDLVEKTRSVSVSTPSEQHAGLARPFVRRRGVPIRP